MVDTRAAGWVASPESGVKRVMLDRDGGEVARATSLVRYAAGARFSEHEHAGGEEFLVHSGEFRDQLGVYPGGSYVRNPWGSRHAPWSDTGCVLFVKLRQMQEHDNARVFIEGAVQSCTLAADEREHTLVLHEVGGEWVALVRWRAGHDGIAHDHPTGVVRRGRPRHLAKR